jgi:hypothetical protein
MLLSWKKFGNRPNTKMALRHEDRCAEIDLTFGVADNPDPLTRRSLGAQRLHNIDSGSARRGEHRCDNGHCHQHERRDGHRQCSRDVGLTDFDE